MDIFMVVVGVVLVLCLPGLLTRGRANGRSPKLKQIAAYYNWQYQPDGWFYLAQKVRVYDQIEGTIKGLPAQICDVARSSEQTHITIGSRSLHLPPFATCLILYFPCDLPRLHLFPKTWLWDDWLEMGLVAWNFTVYSDANEAELAEVFSGDLRKHYERRPGLHMQTFGQQLLIWLEGPSYLSAKKQRFETLMEEGRVAVEVMGRLMTLD